jgi:subtilisin-like proprotein convertase family protein
MLEVNPDLTWRDVQHILVRSAVKNDASDADWSMNGAGWWINHKYGFGMIDAEQAVALAASWTSVPGSVSHAPEVIVVDQAIPDCDPSGITSSVSISRNLTLEHVEVVFSATHTYRGDLAVTLISPDGTESVLSEEHLDAGQNYAGWTFRSVRHWDESSKGVWTIRVADTYADYTGTFDSWQLILHGTQEEEPQQEPLPPGIFMLLLLDE